MQQYEPTTSTYSAQFSRPSGWHEANCYSDRPINIH